MDSDNAGHHVTPTHSTHTTHTTHPVTVPVTVPEPPKEVNRPKGMSILTKILIAFALLLLFNVGKSYFAGLNPELDHFSNDLLPDTTFDVEFVLHDLKAKSTDYIHKGRQLVYTSNETLSSTNFTVNLSKSALEEDPLRYRVEVQVLYNSPKLKHVKAISCYSHAVKPMETKIKTSEFYDPVAKGVKGTTQPHVFTKLHYSLTYDANTYDFAEPDIPNYLYQMEARKSAQSNRKTDAYFPHLDCSLYWTLRRDKLPLSHFTNDTIPVEIAFTTQKILKQNWITKLYIAEQQSESLFSDVNALEEFKVILSDNSFNYLVILFSVNFLHTLFSFLSIKNNISFYRGVKSRAGISMRKHYTDILFQGVIILYLIDNDTSIVVIALTVVEGLLSVWIAVKMTKFERRADGKFPYWQLEKGKSESECETEKYDRKATTFLSWIFFPLLAAYVVYSWVTAPSIDYYTFILKNLVAFIHAVGFINMTPQIYINYKMKSVEFLPWKGMVYQFLNTIIDDLFAFAVKMPTLQRISVFRDDVIFVIYLVQKWIYRKNVRKEEEEKVKKD